MSRQIQHEENAIGHLVHDKVGEVVKYKYKCKFKVGKIDLLTWSMTVWGRLSASMSRTKQSAPESSRLSRRQARTFLIRIDLQVKVVMSMVVVMVMAMALQRLTFWQTGFSTEYSVLLQWLLLDILKR